MTIRRFCRTTRADALSQPLSIRKNWNRGGSFREVSMEPLSSLMVDGEGLSGSLFGPAVGRAFRSRSRGLVPAFLGGAFSAIFNSVMVLSLGYTPQMTLWSCGPIHRACTMTYRASGAGCFRRGAPRGFPGIDLSGRPAGRCRLTIGRLGDRIGSLGRDHLHGLLFRFRFRITNM